MKLVSLSKRKKEKEKKKDWQTVFDVCEQENLKHSFHWKEMGAQFQLLARSFVHKILADHAGIKKSSHSWKG